MESNNSNDRTSENSNSSADRVVMKCKCGLRARSWISRSDANPRRKFAGCPNFGDPILKQCDFFIWLDDETSERIKRVFAERRAEIDRLKKLLEKKEVELSHAVKLKEYAQKHERQLAFAWMLVGVISFLLFGVVTGKFNRAIGLFENRLMP